MKAAPVVRALNALEASQRLVHTGQHYSDSLSIIFFRVTDLREPDLNLGVDSGSHDRRLQRRRRPMRMPCRALGLSILVLYGDINSTLPGALVAAKLGIDAGHVEAGLRSFDRSLPDEVNRVVVDALADVLFATSPEATWQFARGRSRRTGSIFSAIR